MAFPSLPWPSPFSFLSSSLSSCCCVFTPPSSLLRCRCCTLPFLEIAPTPAPTLDLPYTLPEGPPGPARGRSSAGEPACGAVFRPPTRDQPHRPTRRRAAYPAPISLPCTNRPTLHPGPPRPRERASGGPQAFRPPGSPPAPREPPRGKGPRGKKAPGGTAPLNKNLHFTYPVPGDGPPSRPPEGPPGGRLPSPRHARLRGHFRLSAKFAPPAQDDRPTLHLDPAYPAPPHRAEAKAERHSRTNLDEPLDLAPPNTHLPTLHPPPEGTTNNKSQRGTMKPPARRPSGGPPTLGKSRRRTAYPQQIVTTRLLYCLQDRFAQLSRLQRI